MKCRVKKITFNNLLIQSQNCSKPVYSAKAILTSLSVLCAWKEIWLSVDALIALCPLPCVRNACAIHINRPHFIVLSVGGLHTITQHLYGKLALIYLFNITRMKVYVKRFNSKNNF